MRNCAREMTLFHVVTMVLVAMAAGQSPLVAEVDCGNGNICGAGQTCMSSAAGSGLRYACSPVEKAVVGPGPEFSCPASYQAGPQRQTCVSSVDGTLTPALLNVDARSSRQAIAHDMCDIVKTLLYWACECTPTSNGNGNFKCGVLFFETYYWLKLEARGCDDPQTWRFSLGHNDTETVSNTLSGPIPLWIDLPTFNLGFVSWLMPELKDHLEDKHEIAVKIGGEASGPVSAFHWQFGLKGCWKMEEISTRVCVEKLVINTTLHDEWMCKVV